MVVKKKRGKVSTQSKVDLAESKIMGVEESFEYLKLLAYGKNGVGKTRLGASGPRPLIIDCNERGTLSIRNFEGAKRMPVDTWTDIDIAFWYLARGTHDFDTVVIDTISSLAQLCMRFVLGDEASRDPTMDPMMPSKREWGKVGELMRTVILNFRNLDMHVVFLAQERRGFGDEDDEAPEVFPDVSPSIRSTLTASVDIIGYMYHKEVVPKKGENKGKTVPGYRMRIGPSDRYVTKDRSEAGLPGILPLPDAHDNLEKIINRIKKGATVA